MTRLTDTDLRVTIRMLGAMLISLHGITEQVVEGVSNDEIKLSVERTLTLAELLHRHTR